MRKALALFLSTATLCAVVAAQTPPPQNPQQTEGVVRDPTEDEIIRITSELVQTDVVVTDKNDQIINDLNLSDFELYDNGKKQDLKFMEFIGVDSGHRTEGQRPAALPADAEVARQLSSRDVRRVIAFVVDDLTIPREDLVTVRQILTDFVNTQMREGDLVAIVRVVGGKGLLQQFTSDRQLLRRAIAELNVRANPYSAFNNAPAGRLTGTPAPVAAEGGDGGGSTLDLSTLETGTQDLNNATNETNTLFRGLFSLSTAANVIDGLKQLPGRKSLVLFSGGLPYIETEASGVLYTNFTYLIRQLTDKAVRAGVAINTMDPRGLKATPGVVGFDQTPARSSLPDNVGELAGGGRSGFGRGRADDLGVGNPLAGPEQHQGLIWLASSTGGVSSVNSNNFKAGLDKVLARSNGYYMLAYTPSEKFDNKFHKIEVKVRRADARVYKHEGYFAREDTQAETAATKEAAVLAAARSPLAKTDVDVSANVSMRLVPQGSADVGVNLLIDPKKLSFKQTPDGKYQTAFDVVGFVYDQTGKMRGGFSETVNTSLSQENYQKALQTGLTYSANTQLPPGYYQLGAVVRESSTGNLGSISRYLEVPDLSKGRLTMSSIFLHAVGQPGASGGQPEQLAALRQVSRSKDLRYTAIIYNARLSGGRPQLRSQLIISQNGKVLFQEPEQAVEMKGTDASQIIKVGQLGLSKVPPGRYILTLVVTDPLADKKSQTISRSIDFTVVN